MKIGTKLDHLSNLFEPKILLNRSSATRIFLNVLPSFQESYPVLISFYFCNKFLLLSSTYLLWLKNLNWRF